MICFVADVHVGNPKQHGGPTNAGVNHRGALVLNALQAAVERANELTAPLVVVGDLFDSSRPEAQLIARVQTILSRARRKPVCILGNHEMVSEAPGDHSLAPLSPVASIVERPTTIHHREGRGYEDADLICIPFRPGRAVEWLPEALTAGVQGNPPKSGSPVSPPKVLALHLGLLDNDTAPWLKDSNDAVPVTLIAELCKKHGIKACYAGNWHDRRTWNVNGVRIEQIGALHPTGWNNPGDEYGFVSVFGGDYKPRRVSGARFVNVTKPSDLEKLEKDGSYFVKSNAREEHETEMLSALAALQGMGRVIGYDHDRATDGVELAAARTALIDARAAAKQGGDAVSEYVAAMPLAEGVDRALVLQTVKGFLGGTI